jgi:outer membrane receptor protein involved in Fe transport
VVDARLKYAPEDENWRITAYATNILDELYVSNASQTSDGIGNFMLGAPQEFGLQLGINF